MKASPQRSLPTKVWTVRFPRHERCAHGARSVARSLVRPRWPRRRKLSTGRLRCVSGESPVCLPSLPDSQRRFRVCNRGSISAVQIWDNSLPHHPKWRQERIRTAAKSHCSWGNSQRSCRTGLAPRASCCSALRLGGIPAGCPYLLGNQQPPTRCSCSCTG